MRDNDPQDEELRQLIEDALKININAKKHSLSRAALMNNVAGFLEEHLDSFILLAYDMEGRPVTLKSTRTDQQNEALSSLLIKYFSTHISTL